MSKMITQTHISVSIIRSKIELVANTKEVRLQSHHRVSTLSNKIKAICLPSISRCLPKIILSFSLRKFRDKKVKKELARSLEVDQFNPIVNSQAMI